MSHERESTYWGHPLECGIRILTRVGMELRSKDIESTVGSACISSTIVLDCSRLQTTPNPCHFHTVLPLDTVGFSIVSIHLDSIMANATAVVPVLAANDTSNGPILVDTQHEDLVHDAQLDYYGCKLATCSSGTKW
jgi:hypothetical protein